MKLEVTDVELNRLIHRIRHETLDTISVSLIKIGGWSETRILRAMQHAIQNLVFDLDEKTVHELLFLPDPDLDKIDSKKMMKEAT